MMLHVDLFMPSLHLSRENNKMALKTGANFFYLQNSMLFFLKCILITSSVALYLNNDQKVHIFSDHLYFLNILSCCIFII